jgi:hypothetical protein
MPRDADSGKVPLKRGDACLYCRKRRIKCSAEKPSCSQCNGKRECTYDNGKPVSRVRQLEDKVAQLESMLLQTSSRRPSESEGESSRMGSRSGSGNIQTNVSGNQPPASDINMQQERIPEDSGFSYEGEMDDMQFDLNAIQQQFNNATSDLSNDFFSFGGSMFGDASQPTQLPMLSNPNQDATAIFDFSTLDPNFMSLVNSFDNTLQAPQSVPSQPPPTAPPQTNPFATTVTDETSTGFTPYINPDYGPSPSTSTGYPLSRMDNSVPTPGLHFEQLSNTINNARNDKIAPSPFVGEPTWSTGSGSGSGPSPYANSSQACGSTSNAEPSVEEWDTRIAQALGDQPSAGPSPNVAPSSTSYSFSNQFQKPAESRAGLGAPMDQEGHELVGGWFDANDLPRVARDHLYVSYYVSPLWLIGRLDLFFSGMRMFAQIFHVPRFFAR